MDYEEYKKKVYAGLRELEIADNHNEAMDMVDQADREGGLRAMFDQAVPPEETAWRMGMAILGSFEVMARRAQVGGMLGGIEKA